MSFEIEKKYSLTVEQRDFARRQLELHKAVFERADFETNTLFRGGLLDLKPAILRLRETENRAWLTYKESLPSASVVKRRIEHETEISDGKAARRIVESLGYKPSLVYEKRREIWHFGAAEIALDELPFGFYLEIEAAENEILLVEQTLNFADFAVEHEPYPALTAKFGRKTNGIVEARFERE